MSLGNGPKPQLHIRKRYTQARREYRLTQIVHGDRRQPVKPAAGPMSYPIRCHDPETQRLIDEALRARGLKA